MVSSNGGVAYYLLHPLIIMVETFIINQTDSNSRSNTNAVHILLFSLVSIDLISLLMRVITDLKRTFN